MFHADDVGRTIVQLQSRIEALERELASLKRGTAAREAG
jgi:hypothetical protein